MFAARELKKVGMRSSGASVTIPSGLLPNVLRVQIRGGKIILCWCELEELEGS